MGGTFTRIVAAALLALLAASGCVPYRLYRPESIVRTDTHDLAFIELDDQGELWSPAQVRAADQLIREIGAQEQGLILGVFIHGWQHNASPQDGNVTGFESLLDQIAELERKRSDGEPRRVVGVYLGWRGRTSSSRLLAPLTFFSRFAAARRTASTATTDMLFRILLAGRSNPSSTTVVIGHSFGGLILEASLAQAFIGALGAAVVREAEELQFPADLVLLLNPASQAIEAKQLVDIFERRHVKFYRDGADGTTYEVPLVVSMTSSTDLATRVLFPIGMRLRGASSRFRDYGPESCARGRQADYFRRTAGHQRALHSHLVRVEPLDSAALERRGGGAPGAPEGLGAVSDVEYLYDPETRLQTWSAEGERLRYNIHQNPRSWNDTPYWVMEVPPQILPDHSRIFRPETIEFASTLIAMGGALESGDRRARLVRDDRVKPVTLGVRSNGSVSFLDRSQRVFEIDPVSLEPRFVTCVPQELLAVEDVIATAGSRENAWVAGTFRGHGKNADEARVGVTRMSADDSVEAMSRVLPRGVESAAAVFDLDSSRMFLARSDRSAIDVVDLARKDLVPETLLDLGDASPLRLLAHDRKGDRLFASDGSAGVVAIDLSISPPRVDAIAGDFDLPSALAFDPEHRLLYVATAADGAIWSLDCAAACGPPRRLALPAELSHPRALAVDAPGVVWVGDLENRTLVGLSPEGETVQVVERLPEE